MESCDAVTTSFVPSSITSSAQQDLVAIDLSLADVTLDANTQAVITFNYTGTVGANPSVKGLHRSAPFTTCEGNDCQAKVLIASQLERTGARNVFPSYDVPAAKAKFEITVKAPVTAPIILNNMEESSRVESADGKYVTVEFNPTPVMSTYLVAITAGDLKQVKSQAAPGGGGYTVRGWATPGKESLMEEAVRVGTKALDYYTARYYVQQPVRKVGILLGSGKEFYFTSF